MMVRRIVVGEWTDEKANTPSFSPHSHVFHGKFIYPLLEKISRRGLGFLPACQGALLEPRAADNSQPERPELKNECTED